MILNFNILSHILLPRVQVIITSWVLQKLQLMRTVQLLWGGGNQRIIVRYSVMALYFTTLSVHGSQTKTDEKQVKYDRVKGAILYIHTHYFL